MLAKESNQDRFRKCVMLAEKASTPEQRQLWLSMAQTRRKLAQQNGEKFSTHSTQAA